MYAYHNGSRDEMQEKQLKILAETKPLKRPV